MISILIPSHSEPNILKMIMAIDEIFPDAQVIIANDRYGKGKGWAVREALSQAKFKTVCFIDGDMDIHPRMIFRLLPFILDGYDIVVGKKLVRGLLSRRILTKLSRFYIWSLFGLNIDTQTGIKIFRRDAIQPWLSDSFAFDIEILANARRAGYQIIEVPVEAHIERPMKISSIWKCFLESIGIFFRIRRV